MGTHSALFGLTAGAYFWCGFAMVALWLSLLAAQMDPTVRKRILKTSAFWSGSMGFFVDFDLEHPPKKAGNEFRIIFTGGSGAQGWGATSNTNMVYWRLQEILDARCQKLGVNVRVINLAMGASISYQNFIALNRWGHALEPDLILSYSGRNDFVVCTTLESGTDAHFQFTKLNALALASRSSETPDKLFSSLVHPLPLRRFLL